MPKMISPFAPSSSQPGIGRIVVNTSPIGASNLHALTYTYPLKLISPSPKAGAKCILVFLLTYGGGLVAGDTVSLSIDIAPSSRLSLVTQGSTKVFKALDRTIASGQTLTVNIQTGGALVYLPDPVQPFDESVYSQRQVFKLDRVNSSLCVLDWVSEGRTARGEKWGLWSWKGRNELWGFANGGEAHTSQQDVLLLRDNVLLEPDGDDASHKTLIAKMDDLGVFGTLILRGPVFASLSKFFLEELSQLPRIGARNWSTEAPQMSADETRRTARLEQEKNDRLLWTAAAIRGSVVVKFGAREVEGARKWLSYMLRDEGSIVREFGEESLLCLK
ncbi:MAG: hypothetical protein M4579_002951 [Chaenotheca gracillima]|nr:MAG: hypothetical protein M4579_002951 [Chaenotheca gracillima]